VYGGWFTGPWWCECSGHNQEDIANYRSVLANLTEAAKILKESAAVIENLCGRVNSLAFVRWMWGCRYTPINPITGEVDCDHLPPGIPDIFVAEVDKLIATQHFYADKFGDDKIGIGFTVSLSATKTVTIPGSPITFNANVSGGVPPYTFRWNFGDGSPLVDTPNPSVAHAYTALGAYQATVTAIDNNLRSTMSAPLAITIQETEPAGNLGLWALLGLLGLIGVIGLSKGGKNKRQQAAELRARAARLRAEGKPTEAAALEAEATRLEQLASIEEAEQARKAMGQR